MGLLCSDGLTRHVSDERIRDRLRSMTSARQACHDLLEDALDAGGEDNITVLVGRMVRRDLESTTGQATHDASTSGRLSGGAWVVGVR